MYLREHRQKYKSYKDYSRHTIALITRGSESGGEVFVNRIEFSYINVCILGMTRKLLPLYVGNAIRRSFEWSQVIITRRRKSSMIILWFPKFQNVQFIFFVYNKHIKLKNQDNNEFTYHYYDVLKYEKYVYKLNESR